MPHSVRMVVVLLIAEAASAALLAGMLAHFHRRHRQRHLLHWSASWCAGTLYLVALLASAAWAPLLAGSTGARLALGVIAAAAAAAQIAWLVLGADEFAGRRTFAATGTSRRLAAVALAVGSIAALLLDWGPLGERYLYRVGLRSALSAGGFALAAWLVWRAGGRADRTGVRIAAASFAAAALHHLHYLLLAVLALGVGFWAPYAAYLGVADLALQWVIGLGMIVSLLEDERANAARAAEQVEHLAYHDVLTGLPNRRLFADRLGLELARVERKGGRLAVMFLDLDQFKLVNDSLGHRVGDALLRQVTRRMRDSLREADTLARLGGDEFTMLFPDLESAEDAGRIARKVLAALHPPFRVESNELRITGSIGIAVFPQDGRDAEALVQSADAAMYRAKALGRGTFQFSSADMIAAAARELEMESAFRIAVEECAFVLHYQPMIDVRTGLVRGCEALVRWVRPDGQLLFPADFIRIAQRSGLVPRLDGWVLNAACTQMRRWHTLLGRELAIAVNLTAAHFLEPDLVRQVTDALEHSGLPAHCLEIEVTEGLTTENVEATLTALHALKNVGVRISIDDFGAGSSSLGHLKRLPVDMLKVDRSLIADVHRDGGAAAIVSTVAGLGRSLGLKVVAEGVESEEQFAAARRCGCHFAQGFLLGRPAPAAQAELLLRLSLPARPEAPARA